MDGNLADIESDDEEPPPLPGTIQISDEAKRFLRMRDALGPANTQSVFCVRLVVEKILQTVDASLALLPYNPQPLFAQFESTRTRRPPTAYSYKCSRDDDTDSDGAYDL